MRLFLLLTSLFIASDISAQIFQESLYSEYNLASDGQNFGRIIGINDTLAILDFYESNRHNAQIVATYQYSHDSLIVTELDTLIELNRNVEYTYNDWMNEKNIISIGYGPHYYNRGYMYFDTLTFEVDGILHHSQIGTAVNYIRINRPLNDSFLVKVYDDSLLIDTFDVRLPKDRNTILFDKDVIETSYARFGATTIFPTPTANLLLERLPDSLSIDDKVYKLIVRLIPPKEANFSAK